mmetsp:Transcript_2412/g.5140  ORF Transcript_2412/g.5140 Transcript_2412/m.5140 type:complete len:297 (-) Transcript_2412:456-1346(-)
MQSKTASRTRHCLSLPRSLIAGRSDWDNTSTPTTVESSPSVLISFSRTSGLSSLIRCRKMLIKNSTVSSGPKIGVRPKMDPAMLTRTCWDCSLGCVSFSNSGIRDSRNSLVGFMAATALMCAEAIIRTSTSWSESCWRKSGTIDVSAVALKTLHSCSTLSAIMYRTRHDLSSAHAFTTASTGSCHSDPSSLPKAMQLLMARMRTESCSSFANFSKASNNSASMESLCKTSATPPSTFAAWRLTIGVSSPHSLKYSLSRSSCFASLTFGIAEENKAHADILELNQSCVANRVMRAQT